MKSNQVAVIGLGFLGRGIAACFLAHGFEVIAVERDARQRDEASKQIEAMIGELIDLGGFDPSLRSDWKLRYAATDNFHLVRGSCFAVESVTEDIATKQEVFDLLESLLLPDIVIGSNTSAIPISTLQHQRKHPERFVGMHWAEPAHATRFTEIIRGAQTGDAAVAQAVAMAQRLGKEPCVCHKDVPGFIVNRIGYAMYREAMSLMEAGVADAETIDRAMRNTLGLWASLCGPLRWIDITGGPELYARAMQHVVPTLNNNTSVPAPLQQLADEGARGIANGRGFHQYTAEEAHHWEELYRRHAWRISKLQNEYFPLNNKVTHE